MKKGSREYAYYILNGMKKLFPDAKSELENWSTPFQFLVCVILSAQMTDAGVNKVTKGLFEKYPTPEALSNADPEDVEILLKSINYYRAKSRYIVATSKLLLEEFHGEVPNSVVDLVRLPGVGNKTANVVLNDLFEANEGIGADTHVIRVSNRLGLSKSKDPDVVAKDLQKVYDREDWHTINSVFVLYGRYVCKARIKPENSECIFKEYCSWCGQKN